MILACHNIEKAFGEREIVRDGSFHIEDREKAALVGVNGAGKSTILKLQATQVYTHNSIARLREIYAKAHPREKGGK